MGKLRIVKQYGVFRVEEQVTKYQYNEPYTIWETINIDGYKQDATFNTQEEAEKFAERYLNELENKKEVVIKEYNF